MSSRIVRRARLSWWIEHPAHGEGLDTETGPFLTRTMARLHRWIWCRP
jgi:hypothetical protein